MRFGFGLGMDMLRDASAAAAPQTIASLYGTGLGQVPLHLDPATAVMAGSDVASIPNSGGAGAAFNTTATTTGITRNGNLLGIPNTNVYLQLANAADMVGVRLFMVAALDAAATGSIGFTGRNIAAAEGQRAGVRWLDTTGVLSFQRWSGTLAAYEFVNFPAGAPLGSVMHLIEVEIAAGMANVTIDGASRGSTACTWPDFLVDRVFAGNFNPGFFGQGGDVVSLIVNGNQATQIATIRNALAAKHGITLA